MSKTLTALIVAILLLALMVITCPGKEEHKEALKSSIATVMEKEMTKDASDNLEMGLATIGTMLATSLVDYYLDTGMRVSNYFIFSTGEIQFKGEAKTVSYGFLNHVFTISPEELEETLEKEAEKNSEKEEKRNETIDL